MITDTISATPTKLRSGAWGAKVQTDVSVGDTITITTRGGKSWTATVERVVWSNGDVSICATRSTDTAPTRKASTSRSRGTWTGCRCGSVEEYTKDSDCNSCQFDA